MKKIEVYFDYLCPYCYKGHKNLKELLPSHPDVEVVWMPCEAHPRPEVSKIYSDVAMMGFFFLRDNGGDLDRYNDTVYEAHFENHLAIDDCDLLASIAKECGVSEDAFRAALSDGRYSEEVLAYNRLAWGDRGWEAVPSYAAEDGRTVGSQGGILVPYGVLDEFLSK